MEFGYTGLVHGQEVWMGEVNVFGTPCDAVTPYWERVGLVGDCCLLGEGCYFVGRNPGPQRFWDWAMADWIRSGKPAGLHPSDVWKRPKTEAWLATLRSRWWVDSPAQASSETTFPPDA